MNRKLEVTFLCDELFIFFLNFGFGFGFLFPWSRKIFYTFGMR